MVGLFMHTHSLRLGMSHSSPPDTGEGAPSQGIFMPSF